MKVRDGCKVKLKVKVKRLQDSCRGATLARAYRDAARTAAAAAAEVRVRRCCQEMLPL